MLKAIVFDFDGVIADSEPLHFAGFRDVLAEEGIVLTERDYYDQYLGFDDAGAFRIMGRDRGCLWSQQIVGELVERKAKRLQTLTENVSILFPGAADAIRRAAAAVPIAIASGALRREVVGVLRREGLEQLFTAIVAAEDAPASKPSPDPYLTAIARLSNATSSAIEARDCVAIEDSRWGIESARAAGLHVVAVTQSYETDELASVDMLLSQIGDLDISTLRILVASQGT
jgi:HAD superfamily hydrolase (TIGR01509 family)